MMSEKIRRKRHVSREGKEKQAQERKKKDRRREGVKSKEEDLQYYLGKGSISARSREATVCISLHEQAKRPSGFVVCAIS